MKDLYPNVADGIFKELFLASPVASYICDKYGALLAFNDAAAALWGHQPKIGETKWYGALAIYDLEGQALPAEVSPVALFMKGMEDFDEGVEIILERPDRSRRNVLVFPRMVLNDSGEPVAAHVTLIDITDHKKYDEKQAVLSAIVESSDDAIVSKTLDGTIISWNKGAQRIFGYEEEEIIGKSVYTLIPSYLYEEEVTIIKQVKAGKQVAHYQTTRVTKSGKEVEVSLTVSPIRNSRNQIIGASKIARDISDQLQRDQLIQFNAHKLGVLHAISKVISQKLDADFIVQTVIDATTDVTGADIGICCYWMTRGEGRKVQSIAVGGTAFNQKEISTQSYLAEEFLHEIFKDRGNIRFDNLCDSPKVQALFNEYRATDFPEIRHCLAVPIYSADNQLIGSILLGYTQQKAYQGVDEEITHSIASQVATALENTRLFEEVNALNLKKNEFIALASHELKTPLTTVKGYLQILERYDTNQMMRRFLTKALTQLNRIEALINELLDISKIEAGKLSLYYETFNISELIADVVETFHFSSQTHHIIVNNLHHVGVCADRQRIEQVLINLLSNAIKYSPDVDKVFVTLETSDTHITVKVTDEGVGLSREQQEKIFTRFFRVEGTSKMPGLGLGLYLSKEIIERHGGHIGVESEIEEGSTFYFSIPHTQQDGGTAQTLFD